MNLILPQAPADADQKLKDYAQEVKKALQGLVDQIGTSTATASSTAFAGNVSTLANNSADANNDIDMTFQALDSTGAYILTRSTTLTKRLDASWAYGTWQGGLDAGAKTSSTWYAVWAIGKTTGEVEALFSTSSTAPTMPSGWTLKKLIGWVITDGSGNIRAFTQSVRYFEWKTNIQDLSSAGNTSTVRNLLTVTAPPGSIGNFRAYCQQAVLGNFWARSTSFTDVPAGPTVFDFLPYNGFPSISLEIPVDSNRQIAWRKNQTADVVITTVGYTFNI